MKKLTSKELRKVGQAINGQFLNLKSKAKEEQVSLFGTSKFGSPEQPLVRATLVGSGHSNFFKIFSSDSNAPYTINGLYVNYRPSGRQ